MKRILNMWCALVLLLGMSVAAADTGIVSRNFVPAGANVITRSFQDKARESVSLDDYTSLKAAIAALPATGGVINVPAKRYPAGVWKYDTNYMSKANVTLRGVKMPVCSATCDRLVGGSVIEGRFNVFADNFTVENIGFDAGKYVVDTYYGGLDTHSANHPNGDTWDAFAFAQPSQTAPLNSAKNFAARNVIALNRDSLSYGHAMLIEAVDGGIVDNVIGMYGIHGVVIKSKNITGTYVAGYGASVNHVIIKSDTYAHGGNIKLGTVETNYAPPGVTPWSAPAVPAYGLLLNPATDSMDTIKIGKLRLFGAQTLFKAHGGAGMSLDNVQVAAIECEGFGVAGDLGIHFASGLIYNRIRFGTATVLNTTDAVAYANGSDYGADAMEFDSLTIENASLRGLQAIGYGRIKIGRLRAKNVLGLYSIDDTARILIGREETIGVPTRFVLNPPAMTAGWQQLGGGFSSLAVRMHNYGVTLKGMIMPTGSPSADVMTLPPYLSPAEKTRLVAAARSTANVDGVVSVKFDAGKLTINDGAGVLGAENFLSLDNLHYEFD